MFGKVWGLLKPKKVESVRERINRLYKEQILRDIEAGNLDRIPRNVKDDLRDLAQK